MNTIYKNIAEALPALSHLRCEQCATKIDLTKPDTGKYLANGWPEHCGYTMRLITVAEEERLLKELDD